MDLSYGNPMVILWVSYGKSSTRVVAPSDSPMEGEGKGEFKIKDSKNT